MDGWLKLDCNTSRSSLDESERGQRQGGQSTLSLQLRVPLTKHFHYMQVTLGEKRVGSNQMTKGLRSEEHALVHL